MLNAYKNQLILSFSALALVAILFFAGKTSKPNKPKEDNAKQANKIFDINSLINQENAKLTQSQLNYINGVNQLDTTNINQKNKKVELLANFWKDSVPNIDLYAFYKSEASKLVNSEKNLTFAAQLFLESLRAEKDEAKLNWKTNQAISLFEKALVLNPNNEDLKIGLGSSYIFGGKSRNGNAAETMKGIQTLLEVVRRDSTNMKAQMVLGIGGLVSGQFEKAIPRLEKVVKAQPNNIEAISFLADAYGATGKKEEAIKLYNQTKKMVNNPKYSLEVDEHIKNLK
jgi:tetratricopeptide (TPR) repeat protein